MNNKFSRFSLELLSNQFRSRIFSPVDLVKELISNCNKSKDYHIFTNTYYDEAIQEAYSSEKRYKENKPLSIIDGIVFAVKANFCLKDKKVNACSHILDTFISPYTATVINRLKNAGGIIIGQTNMDEFAMGSDTSYTPYGQCFSPFSTDLNDLSKCYSSGGSSGGSACCVGRNCSIFSIGSDTGGSVRLPAAHCGVIGYKPSYGLLSRYGLIAFGSSLDCPGIMINKESVCSLNKILEIVEGKDEKDSTSIDINKYNNNNRNNNNKRKYKVGIPLELYIDGLDDEILQTWQLLINYLESKDYEIKLVSIPTMKYVIPIYYIISSAEASSNLSRYDGIRYGMKNFNNNNNNNNNNKSYHEVVTENRSIGFGEEVKNRILLGNFVLSKLNVDNYYNKAIDIRNDLKMEMSNIFKDVDYMLYPTIISKPKPLSYHKDVLETYSNDIMNLPASLAGLPSISLPLGKYKDNFPISFQLVGSYMSDHSLLDYANEFKDILNNPFVV